MLALLVGAAVVPMMLVRFLPPVISPPAADFGPVAVVTKQAPAVKQEPVPVVKKKLIKPKRDEPR